MEHITLFGCEDGPPSLFDSCDWSCTLFCCENGILTLLCSEDEPPFNWLPMLFDRDDASSRLFGSDGGPPMLFDCDDVLLLLMLFESKDRPPRMLGSAEELSRLVGSEVLPPWLVFPEPPWPFGFQNFLRFGPACKAKWQLSLRKYWASTGESFLPLLDLNHLIAFLDSSTSESDSNLCTNRRVGFFQGPNFEVTGCSVSRGA